jgi:hypothetical protein
MFLLFEVTNYKFNLKRDRLIAHSQKQLITSLIAIENLTQATNRKLPPNL